MAWMPIGAIFTVILKRAMDASWPEAVLVAVPMSVLYAFMCLSAWYVCLAAPMPQQSVFRLVTTLSVASLLSSAAWFAVGEALVLSIEPWVDLPGLSERY